MRLKAIQKALAGKFISRYDLTYELEDGQNKVYEMISRNPDIRTQEELQNNQPDSVVLILHDRTGQKILLNKEFRMATGTWVYNFPAGLIDPGESPEKSAERELWEETGLKLVSIDDFLDLSYSAIGFSNEMNVCMVGTAEGTFRKSTSAAEEIEPGWYTREEIRNLLKTQRFAARTQAYCYLWSKE